MFLLWWLKTDLNNWVLHLRKYCLKEYSDPFFKVPAPGRIQELLYHEVIQRVIRDWGEAETEEASVGRIHYHLEKETFISTASTVSVLHNTTN